MPGTTELQTQPSQTQPVTRCVVEAGPSLLEVPVNDMRLILKWVRYYLLPGPRLPETHPVRVWWRTTAGGIKFYSGPRLIDVTGENDYPLSIPLNDWGAIVACVREDMGLEELLWKLHQQLGVKVKFITVA